MSVLASGHIFDNELYYSSFKKHITGIAERKTADDGFKTFLKDIEKEFQQDTQLLTDIEELNHDELDILNRNVKKFNADFDKLNDLYYDKSYFNDGELKQLFASISRQAHKVENTTRKYLYVNQSSVETPGYIKDGLSKFSQEALGKKLSNGN
jgi:hypothetical protein